MRYRCCVSENFYRSEWETLSVKEVRHSESLNKVYFGLLLNVWRCEVKVTCNHPAARMKWMGARRLVEKYERRGGGGAEQNKPVTSIKGQGRTPMFNTEERVERNGFMPQKYMRSWFLGNLLNVRKELEGLALQKEQRKELSIVMEILSCYYYYQGHLTLNYRPISITPFSPGCLKQFSRNSCTSPWSAQCYLNPPIWVSKPLTKHLSPNFFGN